MLSLIIRFCSITVIFNVRIVTPNSTGNEKTTEAIQAIQVETFKLQISTTMTEPSTTPSLDLYDWDLYCKLQPNGFDCANDGVGKTRYYYDTKLEECTKFVFGGCGGQRNIFLTLKECSQTCKEPGKRPGDSYMPNIFCRLQPEFGACSDYIPMFHFDVTTRRCVGFAYSGCAGNQNRFSSQNLCHRVCEDAVDAYGKQDEAETIRY